MDSVAGFDARVEFIFGPPFLSRSGIMLPDPSGSTLAVEKL